MGNDTPAGDSISEAAIEESDTQNHGTEQTAGSIPGSSLTQSLPPHSQSEQSPALPTHGGSSPEVGRDEGMNLDLLDPLECNEEEEKEEETKVETEEAANDPMNDSTQMVDINEHTAPYSSDLPTLLPDPPQDTHVLPTLPPPPYHHATLHRTHSTPLHTPPPSPNSSLNPTLPQQLEASSSILSPGQSLYNDGGPDTTSGKVVMCDGGDVGRVEEYEEVEKRVEDAVVVGGSSGELQVTKVSTHSKVEQ